MEVKWRQDGGVSGPKAAARVTAFGPETHPSCLHLSFHPAATREPDGLCDNQLYRRELLIMCIVVPETCLECKRNKVISGI
jgi:hypothetical protein